MTENGMAMSSLKYELGVEHRSWIEQLTGSTINKTTREFAGGSRELWYVDLDPPVAGTDRLSRFPRNLVLRIDSGVGPLSDTRFNLLREASVYRALEKTNVPVPAIFGMTKDNRALLMERISGSSRLATSTTEAIGGLRSLLISLEALHNLDPTSLDLPSFVKFDNMSDCVLEEINYWQTLAQRTTHQADPLVTLAFSWLSTNTPTTTRQPRLVQGDTGPGNFLMENGHVNALVDWELSHFGDPMEDIAWLDQRCTKSPGPFGDTALRDQLYEELSGSPLDLTAIAAVNGPAIGAGLAFAACCDMIIASDNATFGATEINVGLLGASAHLSSLVGRHKAREMFFTGELVPAAELYRVGSVRAVVPREQLMEVAMDLARILATKSPLALRMAKSSMNHVEGLTLKEAYRIEQTYTDRLLKFEDSAEARAAFFEKREPNWKFQ